jgi:hypothetical protein
VEFISCTTPINWSHTCADDVWVSSICAGGGCQLVAAGSCYGTPHACSQNALVDRCDMDPGCAWDPENCQGSSSLSCQPRPQDTCAALTGCMWGEVGGVCSPPPDCEDRRPNNCDEPCTLTCR